MVTFGWYFVAALLEIGGCYAVWLTLREHRSAWWLVVGIVALFLFGVVLTRSEVALAGRAFAAYGGVYIVATLIWLAIVERTRPTSWDIAGGVLCLLGVGVILFGGLSRQ